MKKIILVILISVTTFAEEEVIPKGLTKKDMPKFNKHVEDCLANMPGRINAMKIVNCKMKAFKIVLAVKELKK